MTHEYTILTGGVIVPGDGSGGCTALGWADDTILALGTDDEVRAISRGDSRFAALDGATVVPLEAGAMLEIGACADLRVLDGDGGTRAVIRAGRLVEGELPGLDDHGHDHAGDQGHVPA